MMSVETDARMSAEREKRIEPTTATILPSESQSPPFDHDTEPSSEVTDKKDEDSDPNIVDWDGPDDPENPMNWSQSKKNVNIFLVSVFTFLTWVISCHVNTMDTL